MIQELIKDCIESASLIYGFSSGPEHFDATLVKFTNLSKYCFSNNINNNSILSFVNKTAQKIAKNEITIEEIDIEKELSIILLQN